MGALHERLAAALASGEVEPLLLAPLYIHDFLCIHPFSDGNGRVARLVTNLLLHRLGYDVGRYISLERIVEETKATYYDSLAASDIAWAEGRHDHLPFTEYLLGVVLRAYREFEANTQMDLDHGARTRMVERAVAALAAEFRVSEVRERCPLVSPETIKTALAKMAKDGKVVCEGRGRFAKWRRLQ
jgi:Fic family protein